MNSFNDLGISPPILKALEEMGFENPTEVQNRAIPHVLKKEDLIVKSKTGSGKTAVFGVSMLQMTDPEAAGPQGLILTPVRELAIQVDSDLKKMSAHLNHRTTALYGQHSINIEVQDLKKGVTIVTGTPGRVIDHIQHGNLSTKNIRFLVLDEADRMLDMGFIDQVMKIIRTLPKDRVTLLFSATIPDEIRKICTQYMKNPETIEIESQTKTVDAIKQQYYRVEANEKRTQLDRLLLVEQPESCMIFCNTRMAVDRVQEFLTRKGYASESLHGDIPQGKRTKTIQEFKQGDFHILVATDVAARGIHVDNLSHVINYDVPVEKDSYVHRIGRTGRAGNGGLAISLVTSEDIMSLYEIEEHIGALIPESDLPSEELYNRRKAEAEKWLQDNAIKVKPRDNTGSKTKGNRKNADQPKSRKQNDRAKNRVPEDVKNKDIKIRSDKNKIDGSKTAERKPVKSNSTPPRKHSEHGETTEHRKRIDNGKPLETKKNNFIPSNEVKSDKKESPSVQAANKPVDNTNKPYKTITRSTRSTAGKPAKAYTSEGVGSEHSKPKTDLTQKHVSQPKKSLFQRLLGHLFGK